MERVLVAALFVALLVGPGSLAAQERWSVELRGGTAWATQDFGGDDLGTGVGLEGTLAYRFMPHLAAYAGWDWMHFPVEESPGGAATDVEETGYAFGLQFEHPLRAGTSPLLRLRVGGTYDHIELEDDNGDIIDDSGHGFGWEAGTGILFPIGERWRLTPGVRYRALAQDITIGSTVVPVDLTYIAVEIGVSRRF